MTTPVNNKKMEINLERSPTKNGNFTKIHRSCLAKFYLVHLGLGLLCQFPPWQPQFFSARRRLFPRSWLWTWGTWPVHPAHRVLVDGSEQNPANTQQNLMIAVSKSVAGLSNSWHVATWAMLSSCLHRALYHFDSFCHVIIVYSSAFFCGSSSTIWANAGSKNALASKSPQASFSKIFGNLLVFQPGFFHCQSRRYLKTGKKRHVKLRCFWAECQAYDVLPTQTQGPSIGLWDHHTSKANQEPILSGPLCCLLIARASLLITHFCIFYFSTCLNIFQTMTQNATKFNRLRI